MHAVTPSVRLLQPIDVHRCVHVSDRRTCLRVYEYSVRACLLGALHSAQCRMSRDGPEQNSEQSILGRGRHGNQTKVRVCPCRLASRDLRARVRTISSCLGKGTESNTGLATAHHIIAVAGRAGAKLVTTTTITPVAGAVKLGLELDARPIDGPRGDS
jgi:hypothetical protein